jgi:hypothetical protein
VCGRQTFPYKIQGRVARNSPSGNPHDCGAVVLEVVADLLELHKLYRARKIKNGLAAMRRSRYQPDWFLDFAKTARLSCLRRLVRNQCGFSAGGRLSGFGAVWRGAWRCSICFC